MSITGGGRAATPIAIVSATSGSIRPVLRSFDSLIARGVPLALRITRGHSQDWMIPVP
jgi:hypothetical protein